MIEANKKNEIKDFDFYQKTWGMTKEEYERYVSYQMTCEEMRKILDRQEERKGS